ncbi:ABC transporter ATP-binding protein [Fischerella thermalis]|uniref:ABC transporter ATP-binding protein n=1 Tax=Fischerella thermalis TaxID=372787 RepID=UPI000C7FB1BD|nr:ABC transporter ATP-binding protein [Fischerella thermalis]PLZ19117.1 ABC transporter ATP-binding protein [Fischerella thermalis WC1110]PLZ32734.1 ABC transporter ATP-binding protein [Fischerella thermalis WC559]PLZ40606.1 ABC transporter ATP-binding protein [Fischerella thermalis WC542]PLZ42492.1 ABC transporter ATP-binding protein [Fischerella thermalis WC538]PLZ48665.1 ABC transporter ATP-binding protein [Fischerella thermalis WC527]
MGEEIAISLKNISKCYKRYARPVDKLKEILLRGQNHAQEFWALRDINLEIPKGETVGIIGQNGSGKSTLLQIIAGTLTPTTGEVWVNGRVSALLELGSGFNPEFTGRQNVFFNGQILGLSKEQIEAKFDDIAAFAEIGDFIEHPVKTYSSGMLVRLAFAVIANTEPSILIVDEALAVGDAKFQARCMKRIREMKEQGVTILFVSHDSSSVKMLCKTAVLMNHGRVLEIGKPKEVVNHYIALLSSQTNQEEIEEIDSIENYEDFVTDTQDDSLSNHRHGNKLAVLKDVKILSLAQQEITKVETGKFFNIEIILVAKGKLSDVIVGISIRNLMGLVMYGTNTKLLNVKLPELSNGEQLKVSFQVPCHLNKGVYTVTVGVHSEEGISYDWIDEMVVFEVDNNIYCDGVLDLKSTVSFSTRAISAQV